MENLKVRISALVDQYQDDREHFLIKLDNIMYDAKIPCEERASCPLV